MHTSSDINVIVVFAFIVLLIAIYVAIIRWVLRINDIVFYLDKINEKLWKMEQEREAGKGQNR